MSSWAPSDQELAPDRVVRPIPWHNDSVFLPKGVTCNNSNYQISASGNTLAYFLPSNAPQCFTNPNGTTQVYYGGWASPYTDAYATDPFFTTSLTQGMTDRRAPGNSEKVMLTFTSTNKRWVFYASDAWYDYGNALAAENTNEWNLDGQYHFSAVPKGPYHGLLLRYRYGQRTLSNTFCGASGTDCPGARRLARRISADCRFKYNRAHSIRLLNLKKGPNETARPPRPGGSLLVKLTQVTIL